MSYQDIILKLQTLSSYHGHLHGPAHWVRVERIGRELASLSQLNDWESRCIEVFALTHDLGRIDDGRDKQHPVVGVKLFGSHHANLFPDLDQQQVEIIKLAIFHHSDGITAGKAYKKGLFNCINYDDDTLIEIMGCCWDADRLDLLRLYMDVEPRYMSTSYWRDVLPLAIKLNKA